MYNTNKPAIRAFLLTLLLTAFIIAVKLHQ